MGQTRIKKSPGARPLVVAAEDPTPESAKNNPLTLWAESPEEARIFLGRAARQDFPHAIERIYVAKRSPKNRSNDYVGGHYYVTSNDRHVTVYKETIEAPPKITDLVQWCTCDVMLSRGDSPLAVLEDTTHIVRMNVYQRVPRLFRAAILGIPAAVLQGTRGLDFRRRGDCWGMYRYIQAFGAISRLYPNSPALPFVYVPAEGGSEVEAERAVLSFLDSVIRNDDEGRRKLQEAVMTEIRTILRRGFHGHIARPIPSIQVRGSKVVVNVGANPGKKSWREKGSGQMDPYIGLIAAAKYIYCFDELGNKTRRLTVRFSNLPRDFWWFRGWEQSRSLYKTLAFKIADHVEFCG